MCLFDPLDLGSGMGKYSGAVSRIRIRDEQPRYYFRVLIKKFWAKILKFFVADPGFGMEELGSATLLFSPRNTYSSFSQRSADFGTREEVSPRSYGRGPA
jgi:hypothetical protein